MHTRAFVVVIAALGMVVPATAGGIELDSGTVVDVPGDVTELFRPPPTVPAAGPVRAGVSVVDASWHVGATAGQYATQSYTHGPHPHGVDPHHHQTTAWPSYGLESRSDVRALVVEAHDGERFAFVANDLYIPQDLVNRRVATILEERDLRIELGLEDGHETGIREETMAIAVSHNHTSVYLSTPSWGVWAFQDVFDIRFFEYIAQRMAEAIVAASDPDAMVRVRMGAAEVPHTSTHRNSYGPRVADDGTPAGYPWDDHEHKITVVRFDEITDDGALVAPLATWVTYGLHPEMLGGSNDLLSGEWVHAMYRMVDAETGGTALFSQRDVGTAEAPRNAVAQPPEARAEYFHKGYAQMTRAARLIADSVLAGWESIETGDPADGGKVVPFRDEFEVGMLSLRFAPPSLRFLPVVSSCRMEQLFGGNPPVPVVGLPDCAFPLSGLGGWPDDLPFDPSVTYDLLREAGVPVPDNLGFPSYTGLQETIQVHLQAIRLGDVGITICPCEQFADQSRNLETRLDKTPDNLWLGFKWYEQQAPAGHPRAGQDWCVPDGSDHWLCVNPRSPSEDNRVTDLAYQRMVAQIENDAAGWDEPENSLQAETDPVDPDDIWGNYTHEELTDHGYDIVVPVSMANDYWGYIVTYREFQAHDHYRKALTGLGPHSSDFLATRLSRMAAELNGGPAVQLTAKDVLYTPENVHQRNRARAIGAIAAEYLPRYAATLPPDAGEAEIVSQPGDVERFDAVTVEWVGGSNWFDLPDVVVEREVDGDWVPFGDTAGHVQVKVTYPTPEELPAWRAGEFEWTWVANFEVFVADVDLPDASGGLFRATPEGTYRFVIRGTRHDGLGETSTYELVSDEFIVSPWTGLVVDDLVADATAGTVAFTVRGVDNPNSTAGPIDYPDSYDDAVFDRYIDSTRQKVSYFQGAHIEEFCFRCSFRPWLDAGAPVAAEVVVDGDLVPVTCNEAGACEAAVTLVGGETVVVPTGGVWDGFGNVNGTAASTTAS